MRKAGKIIWCINAVLIVFMILCWWILHLKESESGLTYSRLFFDPEISQYIGEIPFGLLGLMERNPEAEEFVRNYPDYEGMQEEIDLTEELKCGEIPLFLQWDERWGYEKYGDDFMALNGCGPTCLSMVFCGLSQKTIWNPYETAKMSQKEGYYVDGAGTSWECMTAGAEKMGLTVHAVSYSEEGIFRELSKGYPIICALRKGDFTTSGHFIVLVGVDEEGMILVRDPNSVINSEKSWSIERLLPQIKNLWGYSYNG